MTPQENVPEPTKDQPTDCAAAVEQLRAEIHTAADALRQLLEGSTRILALTPGQQIVLFARPQITTQADADTVRSALQTWFPENPVSIVLGVEAVTITDPPATAADPGTPDATPTTP